MLLGDLPPEMLQRIIRFYVTTVSARQSGRGREVNKVFHSYINEELFARQPISKFKAREAKRLLEKNLELFLSYRTKMLNGAPAFLPSLIILTVDRLLEFSKETDLSKREPLMREVARIVVRHSYRPVNLAIAPTTIQCQDIEDRNLDYVALAIALYSQDAALVQKILGVGVDPLRRSKVFGHSISIATDKKDLKLVQILLSTAETFDKEQIIRARTKVWARVVTSALDKATRDRSWDVAAILLTWAYKRLPKPPFSTISLWLKHAIEADSLTFFKKLREVGYLQHADGDYADSIARGFAANPDPEPTLRYCIKEGLFNKNGTLDIGYTFREEPKQHLLNFAVHRRSMPLAKAAVAVNAYAKYPAALRSAIKLNDSDMVQFLLDKGVDPEAVMDSPVSQSTYELAQPGSEIRIIVMAAIRKKMASQGLNYRPPYHLVYSSDKRRDIYVAYTFQATDI